MEACKRAGGLSIMNVMYTQGKEVYNRNKGGALRSATHSGEKLNFSLSFFFFINVSVQQDVSRYSQGSARVNHVKRLLHIATPAFFFLFFSFFFLGASCSSALRLLPIVDALCSSCYLGNFMHTVGEALYDPVLHRSSQI